MPLVPTTTKGTPGAPGAPGAQGPQGPQGDPGAPQTPYSGTPASIGTATAGTSSDYARGDHAHAGALADLSDVAATAPSSGQVLAWGGSEWAPATPTGGASPSSATPASIGTAAPGTSTDYARGDHVHAGNVTGLGDRFVSLPLQSRAQFASSSRDVQTAIDAHTTGDAAIVLVSPGSYPGATVTISTGKNNFAVCGAAGTPYGGTITSLSAGRGLTVSGAAIRIRIQNLQVEGLTTWSTSGAGVHRIDRCQLVGGLTVSGFSASQQLLITDCEISGTVTIPAGFLGVLIFDRCSFAGATFAIAGSISPLQVSFSSCSGLATVPSPATLNSFNAVGVGLSATVQAWFNGQQGTAGQVLTSAGAGATATWQTPSGIAYISHTINVTTINSVAGQFAQDHQVSGLSASSAYLMDFAEFDNYSGGITQMGLVACTKAPASPTSTIATTEQQAAILGTFSAPASISSLPILDGTTGTVIGPRAGFSGSPVAPAVVTTDTAGRLNLRGVTNVNGGGFRVKIRLRKVSP